MRLALRNYIRSRYLFISIAYLAIAILVLFKFKAAGDDFAIFNETYSIGGTFWRPLEELISMIAKKWPNSYPYVNHILVILAHFGNGCMVVYLLKKYDINDTLKQWLFGLFLFSPAIMGGLLQPDGTGQVLCSFWAFVGLYFFREIKQTVLSYVLWLMFTFMAAMHKEVGITWFVVTPAIGYILSFRDWKSFWAAKHLRGFVIQITIGIIAVALYIILRFHYGATLGDQTGDSQYHVGVGLNVIKNFALLVGNSILPIDSVAFMGSPRMMYLVYITVILSLPISLWLFIRLFKVKWTQSLIIGVAGWLLVGIVSSSPHLIMAHCGELHTYAMVFPMLIIVAILLNNASIQLVQKIALTCFLVAYCITSIHKMIGTYQCGQHAEVYKEKLYDFLHDDESSLLILNVRSEDKFPKNYSSFYAGPHFHKNIIYWMYPRHEVTNYVFEYADTKKDAYQTINKMNIDKFDNVLIIDAPDVIQVK